MCRSILRNSRSQRREGDRLVVAETLTVPCHPDIQTGLTDMLMLMLFGEARQRTVDEYKFLFSECELTLSQVIPTTDPYSLIEAVPTARN